MDINDFKGTRGSYKWDGQYKLRGEDRKLVQTDSGLSADDDKIQANRDLREASWDLLSTTIDEADFLKGLLDDGLKMETAHQNTIRFRISVLEKQVEAVIK